MELENWCVVVIQKPKSQRPIASPHMIAPEFGHCISALSAGSRGPTETGC